MIVVQVHGGLGNQLFQYALGRHLSLRTGQDLWFEVGRRNPSHLGKFGLDKFETAGRVINRAMSAFLLRPMAKAIEEAERRRLPGWLEHVHRIYHERSFRFDRRILEIRHSAYLIGHWQSEHYFVDIAEVLRRDLRVRGEPDAANRRWLGEIERAESVCVHVRRGDYVTNPSTAAMYNVCGIEYYQRALDHLRNRLGSPKFFVFSDDPAWAQEMFGQSGDTAIIDNNRPEERHEDMRLMMRCKHFIIANSSFGWWPAWLASNADKILIAPARWSATDPAYTPDVVPDRWLRM